MPVSQALAPAGRGQVAAGFGGSSEGEGGGEDTVGGREERRAAGAEREGGRRAEWKVKSEGGERAGDGVGLGWGARRPPAPSAAGLTRGGRGAEQPPAQQQQQRRRRWRRRRAAPAAPHAGCERRNPGFAASPPRGAAAAPQLRSSRARHGWPAALRERSAPAEEKGGQGSSGAFFCSGGKKNPGTREP